MTGILAPFLWLLTLPYLPAFSLGKLLCPAVLSYDWQLGSIPLITSLQDYRYVTPVLYFTPNPQKPANTGLPNFFPGLAPVQPAEPQQVSRNSESIWKVGAEDQKQEHTDLPTTGPSPSLSSPSSSPFYQPPIFSSQVAFVPG